MTKRIKRTRDFELTLQIHEADFIATPRESQRNWLLNRAVKEIADELGHLNSIARDFVSGSESPASLSDRTQKDLADEEIMEDWQIPIMSAMAKAVTANHGDVLEIGFGRGIASDFIQAEGVRSHTIIECNDSVVKRYGAWRQRYPDSDIRLSHGLWQDTIGELGEFDGIFFHTYPLNEAEYVDQVAQSSTFAEHFFSTAVTHLKQGGHFSYLTNEIDSLSRAHQRALLQHFGSFTISRVDGLNVPDDTADSMWGKSMVVVQATK